MRLSHRRASSPGETPTPRPRRRAGLMVAVLAALSLGLLAVLSPVASAVTAGTPSQTSPQSDADARRAAAQASAAARRSGTAPAPTTSSVAPPTSSSRVPTTTPRPTTTTTAPPATTAPPSSDPLAQVLAITNAERAKVGCGALTRNAALDRAAQKHSDYQASIRTMTHTGAGGTNAGQRITTEGYTWSRWGENVAYGYSTPQAVMTAWMNSPGHRANILNCSFKEIGLGLGQPNFYWTQDFATKR